MKWNYPLARKLTSPEVIISALENYISSPRKEKINAVVDGRLDSIHLAIEAPANINNALASIRSSEAFGIANIHFIQAEKSANNLRSVTRGAFYWTEQHHYDSFAEFAAYIKAQGILLVGGSLSSSTTLPLHSIPINQPLCLLLGNEQRGLSEEAHNACDLHYQIPMNGMSESLNLSVTAAISLYDLSTRKREAINAQSDLNTSQRFEYLARYYFTSVDPRLSQALLK
jgi:tRNA (guanosine-2'-O-)-methyltransferase